MILRTPLLVLYLGDEYCELIIRELHIRCIASLCLFKGVHHNERNKQIRCKGHGKPNFVKPLQMENSRFGGWREETFFTRNAYPVGRGGDGMPDSYPSGGVKPEQR